MKIRNALARTGFAVAAVSLLAPAFANPSLLPADTVLAFGLTGVDGHAAQFQPFVDEWNRLGLTDSLGALLASQDEELADVPAELDEYSDIDPLELLGRSAWVGLSLSGGNPIPTVNVLAQPTGEALATIQDAFASIESDAATTTLTEGDYTFYVVDTASEDGETSYPQTFALALAGDQFVLSTSPDALRGVLRRLAGSTEPALSGSEGFAAAAELADSNMFYFLDTPAVVGSLSSLVRPFAAEFGVGPLLDEAVSALNTVGTLAGGTSITETGTSSRSVQVVGDANPTVRSLLLERGEAGRDALGFVPATALSVAGSFSQPTGWWDYLNSVLAKSPELGIGSLDDLLLGFGGIDIRSGFFNWVGNEILTVTGATAAATAPGVASENLLGELLFVLPTSSEADAQAGLQNILSTAGMMAGAFTSLDGAATEMNTATTESVAGVDVHTMELTDGVIISWAVTGGYALVSTDATSVAAAVEASAAGGALPDTLARMLDQVPAGTINWAVSDGAASLRSLGGQVSAQLETVAGLSGEGVDFDALEAATSGLEEFLEFVADRTGGGYSYTTVDGNVITTEGASEISW